LKPPRLAPIRKDPVQNRIRLIYFLKLKISLTFKPGFGGGVPIKIVIFAIQIFSKALLKIGKTVLYQIKKYEN